MIKPEDLGGYHPDENIRKWSAGSLFANEGMKLYELVRKHKPKVIVEIGAWEGCSTSYLACAVRDNKKGKLISIDIASEWKRVPDELRKYITMVKDNAFTCEVPKDIDFLYEDGQHTTNFTKNILLRFPSKIVVCHDYFHQSGSGENVRNDFNEILGKPDETYFELHSDCGLAIKYVSL